MSRPYRNRRRRNPGRRIRNDARSYVRVRGPGKFEGEPRPAQFAYDLTLDGMGNPLWSNEGWGAGAEALDGPFDGRAWRDDDGRALNRAEKRFLARSAGAIVSWDSRGFVSATFYRNRADFQADAAAEAKNGDDAEDIARGWAEDYPD